MQLTREYAPVAGGVSRPEVLPRLPAGPGGGRVCPGGAPPGAAPRPRPAGHLIDDPGVAQPVQHPPHRGQVPERQVAAAVRLASR